MKIMENAFRAGLHSVIVASDAHDITPAIEEKFKCSRASSSPVVHISHIPEHGRRNLKRKTPPAETPM
jgi:hypothetical protein